MHSAAEHNIKRKDIIYYIIVKLKHDMVKNIYIFCLNLEKVEGKTA